MIIVMVSVITEHYLNPDGNQCHHCHHHPQVDGFDKIRHLSYLKKVSPSVFMIVYKN